LDYGPNEAYTVGALDRWIRVHFVYRGEIEEVIRTPEFMLHSMEMSGVFDGDCDDVSTLAASLLKAMGLPARFVAIRFGPSPEFKHVYVETFVDGVPVALDATVEPGTPYAALERMVLNV
jgi:transglutaminase-like putative cysteine protease